MKPVVLEKTSKVRFLLRKETNSRIKRKKRKMLRAK